MGREKERVMETDHVLQPSPALAASGTAEQSGRDSLQQSADWPSPWKDQSQVRALDTNSTRHNCSNRVKLLTWSCCPERSQTPSQAPYGSPPNLSTAHKKYPCVKMKSDVEQSFSLASEKWSQSTDHIKMTFNSFTLFLFFLNTFQLSDLRKWLPNMIWSSHPTQ